MAMWFRDNYKTIIRLSYIIPILFAAGVSIAHVVTWYGLTNPLSWAIYLSIGIEIAALSALAGITAKMTKWVYFPFIIVTLIQFIGNVFFSFQFIDIKNTVFVAWVDLVGPLYDSIGMASPTDLLAHKRWLALFAGGLIPVISLSFLHLLIKFNDKEETKLEKIEEPKEPIEPEAPKVDRKDIEEKLVLLEPSLGSNNINPLPSDVINKIEQDKKMKLTKLTDEARYTQDVHYWNRTGPHHPTRIFTIPVGKEMSEADVQRYMLEIQNKIKQPIGLNNEITPDMFIPSYDVFYPETKNDPEPDIETEPDIEDVEFEEPIIEKDEVVNVEILPIETSLEPIVEEIKPETNTTPIEPINRPISNNRTNIERVGFNRVTKDNNSNYLFNKKR